MVTFAVIGTNFITERFLTAAKLCRDFRLGLVYSRSLERADEFAKKWGAPRICDSLEALCADPEVQAVYLASPNRFHAEQAIQLMGAGKHVLCEKPIAPDGETLERMLAAARKNNVVLLEAMRPAYVPSIKLIRERLGQIGPIRRGVLTYCQYSSRYDKFKAGIVENAFDPTLCNGALMDIGVYCVNTMILLFGAPKSIRADGFFLKNSIDAYGTISAGYGGMSVQLMYSKINNSFLPCEIQGEKGSILFEPMSVPRKIEIRYNGGKKEALPCEFYPQDMYYELTRFLQFVHSGTGMEPYHEVSRAALRVMDEARRQIGIDFQRHAHSAG